MGLRAEPVRGRGVARAHANLGASKIFARIITNAAQN
jgi:hypothetical protein